MYHLDIELAADRYILEQTYATECASLEVIAPIVAKIQAAGNDYGKLTLIQTQSGYGDVDRLESHTLRVTADSRLLVDGQDMTLHAAYWLEELAWAVLHHKARVLEAAGKFAPTPTFIPEEPRAVRLTNPAFKPVKVALLWLRNDPCRVQGRLNRVRA